MTREPAARFVVIKPTLACTANCPTCSLRRLLHADARKEAALGLDDWRQVLEDAVALGAMQLTISGGEPTLYGQLAGLVRAGKRLGLRVRVNSNGSLITEAYALSLLDAGLDVMCISLYAASPERMAAMRGNPTLWKKATDAIRILAALERDYPAFEIRSQTILSRENVAEFPALLALHASLGSRHVTVSYLEGDFDRQHLPRVEDVARFREEVLPEALRVCRAQGPLAGRLAARNAGRLFSPALLAADDWASGRYWSRERPCAVPSHQALILANGDVHRVADIARLKAHTGCDAVMIGRAAIGNPWIFAGRDRADVPLAERAAVMHRHLAALVAYHDPRRGYVHFLKHLVRYLRNLDNASELRQELLASGSAERLLAALEKLSDPYCVLRAA